MEEAYHVFVSEIVDRTPHLRETHVVFLPKTGTIGAAQAWRAAQVPRWLEDYPGRALADLRVDYIKLNHLQ